MFCVDIYELFERKNMTYRDKTQSTPHLQDLQNTPQAYKYDRTSIIIPCYNEADRLHLETFINFARQHPKISFVFIDDGSKDLTISLLCGAMAALPEQVDVLMMARNAGKAEAVRHGLKFAAKRGDKYIAFLDADLATPLNAVNDFISVADRLNNIDVVLGSRAGGLGRKVYREIHRKMISLVCAAMGRLATGLALKDTQCGAKLFRNTPHLRNCLDTPFSAGWLFDVELFLRISNPNRHERKNFFEYPVLEWTEIPGSNIKFSDVLKGGFKMISLILNQWKIRAQFKEHTNTRPLTFTQHLRANDGLCVKSVRSMDSLISEDKEFITLDFTNVTSLGPSVFTILTEVCENLQIKGKKLTILFPDNAEILSAAERASFIALFDCTVQNNQPDHFNDNTRFSLAEA